VAYPREVVAQPGELFAKSLKLLDSLDGGKVVSVDTESSGFSARLGARVTVVSMAWRDDEGVGHSLALPFGQGEGRERISASREAWSMVLAKLSVSTLVMFNSHFDHGMLQAGTERDEGLDLGHRVHWDSMVAEKAIVGGSTGGLKATAERYSLTGGNERESEMAIGRWLDQNGMTKGDLHRVPWRVMQPYSRIDAVLTLRLYEAQSALLETLPQAVRTQVEARMQALRVKLAGLQPVLLSA